MKIKNNIFEQDNPEESYYKISPNELLELLRFAGDNLSALTKLPKFGGKPLWVTGNLDLSNKPSLKSLGNIGYIDGHLSISNTGISDLGNTQVRLYVSDSGTPIARKRIAREERRKRDEMDSYRTDGLWDLNNPNIDDEGLKANALFNYLVGENELTTLDDDDKERLEQIKEEIGELENRQENLDTGLENYSELYDEIQDQIDMLESESEELLDDKSDVYVLYPRGNHYGLMTFEILDGRKDEEYTVGTEDEMDEAVLEYAKSYIDDVGMDGFNQSFLEDYIDIEQLKDYFEDHWRDSIYDSPSSYFDDDDFELTREQEKRIEQIESEIEDYESQQNDLDPNQEDYDELYDDFQNRIDELESEKDDIIPETDSPTDDMVEAKVEEYLEDVENNPLRYIKDYGYNINDFINKNELAEGIVDSDGYGIMNSYNGDYDTINLNGESYYIMRIN
jgi:hypothetical protein